MPFINVMTNSEIEDKNALKSELGNAITAIPGKSKAWLVMTASDISPKTLQRLNYAVGDLVDVFTMPLTQDKLADISHKPVAVYAVTDRNLAKLCFDRLSDCGAIKNEEDMSE